MEKAKEIKPSILAAIGNTPIIYLNSLTKDCKAKVACKLESLEPCSSVKDRLALSLIIESEQQGKLVPGKTVIVEPSSGNTGIALAFIGAQRGYKVIIVMPETMSMERRVMIRSFGAEIILTPAAKGMSGAIKKAQDIISKNPNTFMPNQFENPANTKIHRETTGPEIWQQTSGKIDILVSGVGTGGTITGISEYIKEQQKAKIQTVAVEPAESPVLSGGKPGPHKIQGIGAGFVPKIYRKELIDEVFQVKSEEAFQYAQLMAKEEGLMVGISSGAAVFAAIQIAKRQENKDKLIVVVIPSFGERYISTGLYQDILNECKQMPVTEVD